MLLRKRGMTFAYGDEIYQIGQWIAAVPESDYGGLYGIVLQIRDGEDKETENETPDIYCCFKPPSDPNIVAKLEETFSELYGCPKRLRDLSLDLVIMAPAEIRKCTEKELRIYSKEKLLLYD